MVFDVISVFLFANFLYTMVLPNRYKKAYVKSHIYNKDIYKVKKNKSKPIRCWIGAKNTQVKVNCEQCSENPISQSLAYMCGDQFRLKKESEPFMQYLYLENMIYLYVQSLKKKNQEYYNKLFQIHAQHCLMSSPEGDLIP